MTELFDLIFSSHQFFFALVVCFFAYLLVTEGPENKSLPLNRRSDLVFFFISFAIGVFVLLFQTWDEKGIFLAIEFSVLVTFSLIHPKYAISFLLYLLLARPWESYDNQMMSSMPRDISYLAILSIAAHKILKKDYSFRFNIGTFLILSFAVWIFLSAFYSNHPEEGVAQYVEIFSKGIILFILIQNCIEKKEDMLPVKAVFVLAILEKCFVSYYKTYVMHMPTVGDDEFSRLESVGILSNSNDIAAIFVLAVPFTIFFIMKSKIKPFNWILSIIALAGMTYLIWQSQSRGALLGLFSIMGVYFMMNLKSKKLQFLSLSLALVMAVGAFSLLQRSEEDIEGSTSNRKIFWQAGINMAVKNPIFGIGFWGFSRNLPIYAPDGNVGSEKEHMTAHSSWILALAEGGFMALFLFLGLWIYSMRLAWKIRDEQPEYLLGLAGYGVTITFLSHTYLLYPYILLAMVITHYHVDKRFVYIRGET